MSTKTPPVTADSFEKVVAALATKQTQSRRFRSGKTAKDMADWREIAAEAFRTNKLGDTLRRAIEGLSVQYREVLFLHDVKNLSTADSAWVLNITVGAARYRLLRARMHVRAALASHLLSKPSEKEPGHGNSYAHEITWNSTVSQPLRIRFLSRIQGLVSALFNIHNTREESGGY